MEKLCLNYLKDFKFKYFLLTFDDNYVDVASCLIKSLYNNSKENLCFIIFTEKFEKKTIEYLKKLNMPFIIYFVDNKLLNISYDAAKFQWPFISFIRILAPFFIEENIDYLYYLDADMLCISSLDELFNVRFNTSLGLCPEFKFSVSKYHNCELSDSDLYCNSGFIIFNMLKYKKNYNLDSLLKALDDKLNTYNFPDQDFINIYFRNDIYHLNTFKYNNMPYQYIGANGFDNILDNTIIIHCAFYKPWNNKCILYFSNIYKKYCPDEHMKNVVAKYQRQYTMLYPFRFVKRCCNKIKRIITGNWRRRL